MIKNKIIRIFLNVVTCTAVAFILIILVICMKALPEYIVEKDGEKWVARVVAFTSTTVDYYSYKNILIQSNKASFYERYGKGAT